MLPSAPNVPNSRMLEGFGVSDERRPARQAQDRLRDQPADGHRCKAGGMDEPSHIDPAVVKGPYLEKLDVSTVKAKTREFFPPRNNCVTWVPGRS